MQMSRRFPLPTDRAILARVTVPKIEIRPLGSTGLRVSRIGIGLAALGRPGYINLGHAEDLRRDYRAEAMRDNAARVLDAAWDAGIRYFDAARSYGRAEDFLGSWLRAKQISRTQATVGSKWGYTYTANWQVEAEAHEVKEHSLEVLTRQTAESRQCLGEHLDLYQIHSATPESGVLDNPDVLRALSRLRASGLQIGLTVSGPRQAETLSRAGEILIDGEPLFTVVQATWNVFERSAGAALRDAHAAGTGVIIKEALANGRLTERGESNAADTLRRTGDETNAGVDAFALAFVLRQPWVDVVLSGAARVDHLRSNLRALEISIDDELAAALDRIVETPERYWKRRAALQWN
jgi:aryl-alcohol dehydrogenase-like predicted oxidoreductase